MKERDALSLRTVDGSSSEGFLLGLSTYRDSHGGPLTLTTVEEITVRPSLFKANECVWRAGDCGTGSAHGGRRQVRVCAGTVACQ